MFDILSTYNIHVVHPVKLGVVNIHEWNEVSYATYKNILINTTLLSKGYFLMFDVRYVGLLFYKIW